MDAQTKKVTRRRFLSVCAMAGVYAAVPWARAAAAVPLHRWDGILLGARVRLTLAHPDRRVADTVFALCVREIKRLENIFTLYDSRSELSRLNAQGFLRDPSSEMVDILEQSRICHEITGGAFDVTVKPLEAGGMLDLVGMDKVHIGRREIRFEKAGMGVTLNGIAQGYITDRITALLKGEGLCNVLVELGKKRAIGGHPSGRPWFLGVQGARDPVALVDKALATSARLNADTGKPHIFAPADGRYAAAHSVVSVVAEHAAMADALSTGLLSLSHTQITALQEKRRDIDAVYLG